MWMALLTPMLIMAFALAMERVESTVPKALRATRGARDDQRPQRRTRTHPATRDSGTGWTAISRRAPAKPVHRLGSVPAAQ
ncbi:hypothetical protein AVL48_14985 [Amycolatopsis regifaucium]|uniref:Secreted protein n=1 Tax=Amycolatopsis regifaucium TaxID=546365 RepID=A0A154M5Q7_9PSEU|nr:hypothetical protein AVL48_14985 [Amycolatopsis regifaucium]OKA09978.1 hypothetical protein ATP06_0206430 [Amycolatopsis regifaucium]